MTSSSPVRPPLALFVAVGGLIVMALGGAAAGLTGRFDHALGLRYFGVFMGLLMIISGNALPKLSQPHTAGAARTADRLAGWLFVLGGLAVVAQWIWWAEASRIQVASATGLAIFAVVLLLTLILTADGRPAPAAPGLNYASMSRRILFHILHAVMWVFAIFLFASSGDKHALSWTVVLFTASMAIMDVCLTAPWRKPRAPVE